MVTASLARAVKGYDMPKNAKQLVTESNILLLCGVTAAGKNTLTQYLVEKHGYEHVVSHTTRQPRENHGAMEKNAVDYWFVNAAQMLQLIETQKFIEVKQVHGDLYYGTSIESVERVLKHGKKPIIEIDVQGAEELMKAAPGLRAIFLLPPSYEVWMQRLNSRGQISSEELSRRMASAKAEIATILKNPNFNVVINHEVADTAKDIMDKIALSPASQKEAHEFAKSLLQQIS